MRNRDTKGGYTPTEEEKKSLRMEKGKIQLSGDKIFHTVQGEGPFIGRPMTFIRLNRCNLACSFCDTPYTFRTDMEEFYEAKNYSYEEVVEMVGDRDIVFTGGEPLLQSKSIEEIIKEKDKKFGNERLVQIETNGTVPISEYIASRCSIVCSPKIAYVSKYHTALLQHLIKIRVFFKFVCANEEDLKKVIEMVESNNIPKELVYIMPEGITVEDNQIAYKSIISLLLEKGYNTTPRLQNIIWDGALRGV